MFAHWNWDMHAAFRGNCEQLLGQYRLSAETLTGVLARIDPAASSNRAALQADIAAAAAQQGEMDQACALLMQSLAVAVRAGLRERVKRIAGIRTSYLAPARNEPMVRELDELLHSTGWR
jgi:hydroxymethylglutaryl-CoA reductase